jgi:hypothetical protein
LNDFQCALPVPESGTARNIAQRNVGTMSWIFESIDKTCGPGQVDGPSVDGCASAVNKLDPGDEVRDKRRCIFTGLTI